MSDTPPRVQALRNELDHALQDYQEARSVFEKARVRYEAAKLRFGTIRSMARSGMGIAGGGYRGWLMDHDEVAYLGMPIGEAILDVLESYAYAEADSVGQGKKRNFSPGMVIEMIVEKLEAGGFEFGSLTPNREVNAALIHLKGVKKKGSYYEAERAIEFAEFFGVGSSAMTTNKAAQ